MGKRAKSTMFALKLHSCVILSIDSRIIDNKIDFIMDNTYDKVIQLHPKVFLGFLGDQQVCDALKQNLPPDFTPASVAQAADLVKNVINDYVEKFPDAVSLVFVFGALDPEAGVEKKQELKIYKISNEEEDNMSWKHSVEEVMEHVVMSGIGGSRHLKTHVANNAFDPNMTEEEGMMYAFEGTKSCARIDWQTGGEIQVVSINFNFDPPAEGFKRRKWRPDDLWVSTKVYYLLDQI